MDVSKKRHFDLFTTADKAKTQPLHNKEETFEQIFSGNTSHQREHECNGKSRSKEISIGMLTNDVHRVLLPCLQHKLSSCKECELQAATPKMKLPLRDCSNHSVIKFQKNSVTIVPKTPPKANNALTEPLTPTSNLKLLTNLASLENISPREEIVIECQEEDYENNLSIESPKYTSRKEKSLGLLTAKFLSQYPEYPPVEFITEISLDKASKDLNVGRRRIYDVVNVLEAVHIVKKCAKNVYAWLGKTNLKLTLARFKKLAEQEKLEEQILSLLSLNSQDQLNGMWKESSNSSTALSATDATLPSEFTTIEDNGNPYIRKEKSLGMMSQKFMMLLLVSNPQVLSLDLAARFLIGESGSEDKNSTVYKTKMRRLYSITHVLTSLALIEKVDGIEIKGSRKPAYKYTGPSFDDILPADLEDFENALLSLQSSSASSSVLLTKRPLTENNSTFLNLKRVKFPRTKSENVISNRGQNNGTPLTRRPSLQDVCDVAEKERRRLLFPITQRALENRANVQKTAAPGQSCVAQTKPVSISKTSTAILLTSNGTPLRVISISSSPNGSPMLRLIPSTATNESSVVEVKSEQNEIPLVQLPLVLQFKSEPHS